MSAAADGSGAAGVSAAGALTTAGLELVLVRHAETEWSREGLHTGRTDIPLSDAGRAAAGSLRERLREWSFERVLVSPSTRALETCEIAGLAGRAETDADLLEWDYGEYEGRTTPQIHERRPDWNLWRDGAPEGEQAADVGARADRVIAGLRGVQGAVAIFSHGHTLRVLGARWIALGPEQGARLGLSTGAICVLGHERRTPILAAWNRLE